MNEWLAEKFGGFAPDAADVRLDDHGELALAAGPVAIWHPLDDLYAAPTLTFTARAALRTIRVQGEVVGYVISTADAVARWEDHGDASTDTDRFFLVALNDAAAVITWMNEDVSAFERLGGGENVEAVTHPLGARVVVLPSQDGNASVRAGYADDGRMVAALIDV